MCVTHVAASPLVNLQSPASDVVGVSALSFGHPTGFSEYLTERPFVAPILGEGEPETNDERDYRDVRSIHDASILLDDFEMSHEVDGSTTYQSATKHKPVLALNDVRLGTIRTRSER